MGAPPQKNHITVSRMKLARSLDLSKRMKMLQESKANGEGENGKTAPTVSGDEDRK